MATRQELREKEMIQSGINRYYRSIQRTKTKEVNGKTVDVRDESNTSYGLSIMRSFVGGIADALRIDLEDKLGKPGSLPVAWEYLKTIDLETAGFITAKAIVDGISKQSELTALAIRVATKLEDNCRFNMLEDYDKKYLRSTQRYIRENKITDYRQKKIILNRSVTRSENIPKWHPWQPKHKVHIGVALIDAFIKATSQYDRDGNRIKDTGFVEKYRMKKGVHERLIIQPTQRAQEWIRSNMEVCQTLWPDYMPCLERPLDWTNPVNGGFHLPELRRRKPLVKTQRREYLKQMPDITGMPDVYNCTNHLQGVEWEVNRHVYEQAIREFSRARGIKMPSTIKQEVPPCPLTPLERPAGMTDQQFKKYKKAEAAKLTQEEKEAYAEWHQLSKDISRNEVERISKCLQTTRIFNMARMHLSEEKFYFVWTRDFRGRVYAVGTGINPQGTDLSKGLLRFHKAVALGGNGLKHLKYFAAGCFGVDKCTLEDRIKWCDDNKDAIMATGWNPEENRDFWGQADKPYQFLGVCEELAECYLLGGNCEDFMSKTVCFQDGSCNGIQHYSAMLLDPTGAIATNLQDSDIPGDIYMLTANRVIYYLKQSIEKRQKYDGQVWQVASLQDQRIAEALIEFGVERDCTKRPTMVIPYGGTKIGCRDQCMDYIRDTTAKRQEHNPDYQNPFVQLYTVDDNGRPYNPEKYAATYLHHIVWLALDEVVIAARKAMKFIKAVTRAKMIDGKAMKITAPNGFTIFQDIKETSQSRIKTHLDGEIRLSFMDEKATIDSRKMQTSIAPNFVHSIDASHLDKTVCMLKEFGINDVATVHDSYGCHAGNCDTLHFCIRDAFVDLHKENLLMKFYMEQYESASADAREKFPDPKDVTRGTFDINLVKKSRHFFR